MTNTIKFEDTGEIALSGQTSLDRTILAFDALSKLARQFSNRPDFENLIEIVLLTLSGQFALANTFAMLQKPGKTDSSACFFGTGKFKKTPQLEKHKFTEEFSRYFLNYKRPIHLDNIHHEEFITELCTSLKEFNIDTIYPMINNDKLMGIIGLGKRVTGKLLEQRDVDLAYTIINAITPFVAGSYHYWEIFNLNNWYHNTLDNVRQGIYIFDYGGRVKMINKSGLSILDSCGVSLQNNNISSTESLNDVFPEEVFGNLKDYLSGALGDYTQRQVENLIIGYGEKKNIYSIHIYALGGEKESEPDLVITLDDITNEKKSEHRLFELEKFAEKGVLISSIAHDLNNFLAMILGGIEMTQMYIGSGKTEKIEPTLEKLKSNVGRMERFTSKLMDYTKHKAPKHMAALNEIINDVLSFVAAQKKFKDIKIQTELDSDLSGFRYDSDRIAQLLLNILNNAADAIIETSRSEGTIIVSTKRDNSCASLTISDNGAGIPENLRGRLFKAHFTTKKDGHGYGLVSCAKIIEMFKAEVKIESELGKGSTFTLRFPRDVLEE